MNKTESCLTRSEKKNIEEDDGRERCISDTIFNFVTE